MQPKVTIVVSPRERFSLSSLSLDAIYSNTKIPFHMVYIDAGSPPDVQRQIQLRQKKYGFELIRVSHILTPNEARNMAFSRVKGEWIAYVDNDILVAPGWLEELVDAGERNQAELVGPLYYHEFKGRREIHMAGGRAEIYTEGCHRRFREEHMHFGRQLDEVDDQINSGPVELLEFHCMLARKETIERLGGLDEKLMTTMEHIDLCLQVRESDGVVWLCKESEVTYIAPPPFRSTDLPFFMARWQHDWNVSTLSRFAQKWKLDDEDPYIAHEIKWAMHHQEIGLKYLMWPLGSIAGYLKYNGFPNLGDRLVRKLVAWSTRNVIRKRTAVLGENG